MGATNRPGHGHGQAVLRSYVQYSSSAQIDIAVWRRAPPEYALVPNQGALHQSGRRMRSDYAALFSAADAPNCVAAEALLRGAGLVMISLIRGRSFCPRSWAVLSTVRQAQYLRALLVSGSLLQRWYHALQGAGVIWPGCCRAPAMVYPGS